MKPPLRLILLLVLLTGAARAQAVDPAAAELLFAEGRRAMAREDYDTACSKFAESQRLDPGAGTLINLAECLDRRGKLAESWQAWKEALRLLREGDDRRWAVEHRIEGLEKRLPRLEIELAQGAPGNAVVVRDGIELGTPALGLPLPVNPGRHVVVVHAEGHEERSYEIDLSESESERLVVVAGPKMTAPPPSAPSSGTRQSAPRDVTPDAPQSSTRQTIGWIVGGTGVAALAAGSVFGGLALGKKSEMDDSCRSIDGQTRCDEPGLQAAETGQTYSMIANIGFAVGLAGIGVGAYLLLTGDDGSDTPTAALSAGATPGGARLDVKGTF